jgi:hypothetical protein
MKKQNIKAAIRANPPARRHEKVIVEALKAVDALAQSGLTREDYGLASPYGGRINSSPKAPIIKARMTYCA